VVVSSTGTYTVSTPTVNGISFTGTGAFTTTGSQTISLIGTGTPVAQGTFTYSPGNNGCTFSVTVLGDFLSCSIDGIATTFNFNLAGIIVDPTSMGLGGEATSAVNAPFFLIGLAKNPAITTGTYDQLSLTNQSTFCFVHTKTGFLLKHGKLHWQGQAGGFTVIVTSYTTNRIEGTFSGTLYSDEGLGTSSKVVTNGKFSVPY